MTPAAPRRPGDPAPRPRTHRRRRSLAVGAVALAVTGLLVGCAEDRSVAAPAAHPSTAEHRPWDEARGERIVVIGDSISGGHGLHAEQAWPATLAREEHWQLTNFSCDGAGVVAEGDEDQCASTYRTLVRRAVDLRPEVVFVQASSNDLGVDDAVVTSRTDQLVAEVHRLLPAARVVGLSAIWNEQEPPAQLAVVSHAMHRAVRRDGGTSVDIGEPLRGHAAWMQSDDVHPTVRGQQAIQAAVEAAFRRDHVRF